jgi:hypothetical protein
MSNYEALKQEYENYKLESETSIKELEEIIADYDQTNAKFQETNEKLSQERSKFEEELSKLKEKNNEKSKEIQYLEKQTDSLKVELEKSKQDKLLVDKKLVSYENEREDFMNKTRDLECYLEDLQYKHNAALEENVILQNENEACKLEYEESIQRLKDELEDAKNEIVSKEKVINRMTMHRDFLLKTAYNMQDDISGNIINPKSYQSLKCFSTKNVQIVTPVNKNMKIPEKFMQTYSKSFMNIKKEGETNMSTNIKDPNQENRISHKDEDEPEVNHHNLEDLLNDSHEEQRSSKKKSSENFSKQIKLNKRTSIDVGDNMENDPKGLPENNTAPKHERKRSERISINGLEKFLNRDQKSSSIILDSEKIEDGDEEEKEFIRQRIDMEVKTILDARRNFLLNTLTHENFSFDVIGIKEKILTTENDISATELRNTYSQELYQNKLAANKSKSKIAVMSNKNQRLVENIDEMLAKIQARKEKVILQKKTMQNKLEKIGIKIC